MALVRDGIRQGRQWSHAFVQAQFSGVLIGRRKRYPASLRKVLFDARTLRDKADYRTDSVTRTEASRILDRARMFVGAIEEGGHRR